MSEQWRRKTYYQPRVLIKTSDVLDSPFPDGLLCLTGGQLNILRNLLAYATRRANWVTTYESTSYLTPTTEEWDEIQGIVADLEDKVMADCTEMMDKLDDILDALTCICPTLAQMRTEGSLTPGSLDDEEVSDAFGWSDDVPDPTVTGEDPEPACEIAQVWYQAGFEIITEAVLPGTRAAFDVLLTLVAAKVAIMTGGATLPTVLGAVKVADLIRDLIEGTYDASESNLYNWLVTNKEDIVCGLYQGTQAGGTALTIWADVYDEYISGAGGISALDKAIVWLFMGGFGFVVGYLAYTEETAWAAAAISEGYCDDCPLVPIIGNDWWAMPLAPAGNTVTINKGTEWWAKACWQYDVPASQELVGYVIEMTTRSAYAWKRMSNAEGACTGGCQLTGNTSESWGQSVPHFYFYAKDGEIDESDCKAEIAPTATNMPTNGNVCTGVVNARQGLNFGGGTSPATLVLIWRYAIFTGTTPPE